MILQSKRFFAFLLLLLLSLLCDRTSSAALIYEIVFDAPGYSATAGASVNVDVLLRETATDGEALRLSSIDLNGLFSVGFQLDYGTSTSGNSATIPDALISDHVMVNSALDDAGVREQSVGGSIVRVSGTTTNFDPGLKVTAVGNVAEFNIASIQITASTTVGDVTTLQLIDLTSVSDTVFVEGFSPDEVGELSFGSATLEAQAVPEPSTFFALCIGLGSVAGIQLRRRRSIGKITDCRAGQS